jgi:hypothetical protein
MLDIARIWSALFRISTRSCGHSNLPTIPVNTLPISNVP